MNLKKKKNTYKFNNYINLPFKCHLTSENTTSFLFNKKITPNDIIKLNIYKFYNFFIYKQNNLFNYKHFMFLLKSNAKQFFFTIIGVNVPSFKTVSTGKLLKSKKLTKKSLKSSKKANKYLLSFINDYVSGKNNFVSYYLIKPLNRKNLNFFYLILKTFKIFTFSVGFRRFYSVVNKKTKRIKKRIKKKLIKQHTFYN